MSGNGDRPISNAYRRLKIPDAERYWVEQVKCRVGCPVFTDACGYVTAVAEGRVDFRPMTYAGIQRWLSDAATVIDYTVS